MQNNTPKMRGGFTLVEILTTMAIIGILLAVLLPALNQVSKSATTVKQKAQFHAIELGLETFRSDSGDYPPSVWDVATYGNYSASQRLAEAIIGRDGFGFNPASRFRADGKGDIDGDGIPDPIAAGKMIYDVVNGVICSDGFVQTKEDNLAARKGPYLELESANAVMLSAVYTAAQLAQGPVLVDSYLLSDSFSSVKNIQTGKKIGMPILYYKANRLVVGHSPVPPFNANTYNLADSTNAIVVKFGLPNPHPLYNDPAWFYRRTQNPNFTNPPRPYRAESFILQSAGADGLYGTTDDVFNFDEGK